VRIHHTARLERIPVQVIEDMVKGIRGIIRVGKRLRPREPVGGHIHYHIHRVLNLLLPAIRLGHNLKPDQAKRQSEKNDLIYHDFAEIL
jgi:hypothetical protein